MSQKKRQGSSSGKSYGHQHMAASLAQAMQLATGLHQSGKIAEAAQRYRTILAVAPKHADALHYLGVAQHQLGQHADAANLIRQAVKLVPDYLDAHNNLGNVLKESGHMAEAEAEFRLVLAARPDFIAALNNLGVVLVAQKRFAEAIPVYRQAISLKGDFAEAWHNLGNALKKNGEIEEALTAYRQAIFLAPYKTAAYYDLGRTLATFKRYDEALAVYREWQKKEPDNPVVAHMIAAYAGTDAPERASDAYLQKTFDSFAESFDDVLAGLQYRAPGLTGALVAEMLGTPQANLDVLDAGCGTGLCAPYLKPYARRLDGVDLSGGMLAKAQLRGSYDDLQEAELCAWLQQHSAHWDAVVSTDTLIYFGALETVMQAASSALRPGGLLVFTLEEGGQEVSFHLQKHGRFCHGQQYVRACLQGAGLQDIGIRQVTLRLEADLPVAGLLIAARKPA